jgi:hypothetical protein
MQQIYIASYFKSGYSPFMQYILDNLNHPQRKAIERRLEIIKFFDEFGPVATQKAFNKSRSTIYLWKQKLTQAGGSDAPKYPTVSAGSVVQTYTRTQKSVYGIYLMNTLKFPANKAMKYQTTYFHYILESPGYLIVLRIWNSMQTMILPIQLW